MRKVDALRRINDGFAFSQSEAAVLLSSFLLFSFSYYSKKDKTKLIFCWYRRRIA